MSKWISVKDQLPRNKEVVLVMLDGEYITQAVYQGEYEPGGHVFRIELTKEHTLDRVTHWMLLPESPSVNLSRCLQKVQPHISVDFKCPYCDYFYHIKTNFYTYTSICPKCNKSLGYGGGGSALPNKD